ncbi:MAG TPA: RluA family pseudouridine synthase [Labilithrix sp.]|nr:RluA family pseudouridine synthase [Labilithrix sp.]
MTTRTPRQKRWVVREGDGRTVAEIVRKAGEAERALTEGRVFIGRRRVTSGAQPVKPGDEVLIGAADPSASASPSPSWRVIWERDGLLACFKPAGMPTVPDHLGAAHALVALAAARTGRSVSELLVTSRLDREVSGVVIFATSPEAEERLKRAREQGRYARRYVAIARDGATGTAPWDVPIGRGKDARHRAANGPDAKAASTRWTTVARAGGFALLAVEPQTGRTHQIRVHASHAGAPLLGDRDYGGPTRATLSGGRVVSLARIALHAARVTVPDAAGEPLVATAEIPAELVRAWTDLGGAPEAWDMAVTCALGT